MPEAPIPPDFHQLIGQLVEGEISQADHERLQVILAGSRKARSLYLTHVDNNLSLRRLHAPSDEASLDNVLHQVEKVARQSRRRQRWAMGMMVCACLLVTVALWRSTVFRAPVVQQHQIGVIPAAATEAQTVFAGESTTDAVAVISKCLSARISGDSSTPTVGSFLSPGRFVLSHGLLGIDFFNGVRIAVQAPCDIEIVSHAKIICRDGKLAAQIPEPARGFRIDTPHGTVLDLGTGFGVSVQKDQADVHVFEGLVEFPELANTQLRQGKAVQLSNGKIQKSFDADEAQFVTVKKVDELHALAAAAQYDHWKKIGQQLNSDPDLLVRFDCESLDLQRSHELLNRSHQTSIPAGTIVGCRSASGRWPTQRALSFQELSDRVCIGIPDQHEAITLTSWVRVNAYPQHHSGLLMSDGVHEGGFHWQLTHRKTVLLCYFNDPKNPDSRSESETPVVLPPEMLGKWLHFAVVLDARAQQVAHYLNGECLFKAPFRMEHGIQIRNANLGNWSSSSERRLPIRNLTGDMSEFTIHKRPLTDDDIRELYRNGVPLLLERSSFPEISVVTTP